MRHAVLAVLLFAMVTCGGGGAAIQGTVVQDGAPLGGVEVRVGGGDLQGVESTTTDDQGKFSFDVDVDLSARYTYVLSVGPPCGLELQPATPGPQDDVLKVELVCP